MKIKRHACALLLALAASGGAAGDEPARQPGCGEVQAAHFSRRPVSFVIRRDAESGGFKYHCRLRKNKYRQKDPAVFRRECEAFINRYIDVLNRCENAGLSRFMLDPSREQRERRESKKFLEYLGMIPIG